MITYKSIEDKDQSFIETVFRSTWEKKLSLTYLTEPQKHNFILTQLTAQLADYNLNYKGATYDIILYNNKPAGRLYLWETLKNIRVLEITLLPKFQGRGIGTEILTHIINSAKLKNKIVSLHVAHDNQAKKMYNRLGFKKSSSNITHDYLEFKVEL